MMQNLVRQDPPGRHVVAVAEPAGDAEDLKLVEQIGFIQQPVDVQQLDLAAGLCESKRGFLVAVRAGGSENEDVRLGHGEFEVVDLGFLVCLLLATAPTCQVKGYTSAEGAVGGYSSRSNPRDSRNSRATSRGLRFSWSTLKFNSRIVASSRVLSRELNALRSAGYSRSVSLRTTGAA